MRSQEIAKSLSEHIDSLSDLLFMRRNNSLVQEKKCSRYLNNFVCCTICRRILERSAMGKSYGCGRVDAPRKFLVRTSTFVEH